MALKLHGFPMSSCTTRVMACFHEKQDKQPDFLSKNPFGQIPILDDGHLTTFVSPIGPRLQPPFTHHTLLFHTHRRSPRVLDSWSDSSSATPRRTLFHRTGIGTATTLHSSLSTATGLFTPPLRLRSPPYLHPLLSHRALVVPLNPISSGGSMSFAVSRRQWTPPPPLPSPSLVLGPSPSMVSTFPPKPNPLLRKLIGSNWWLRKSVRKFSRTNRALGPSSAVAAARLHRRNQRTDSTGIGTIASTKVRQIWRVTPSSSRTRSSSPVVADPRRTLTCRLVVSDEERRCVDCLVRSINDPLDPLVQKPREDLKKKPREDLKKTLQTPKRREEDACSWRINSPTSLMGFKSNLGLHLFQLFLWAMGLSASLAHYLLLYYMALASVFTTLLNGTPKPFVGNSLLIDLLRALNGWRFTSVPIIWIVWLEDRDKFFADDCVHRFKLRSSPTATSTLYHLPLSRVGHVILLLHRSIDQPRTHIHLSVWGLDLVSTGSSRVKSLLYEKLGSPSALPRSASPYGMFLRRCCIGSPVFGYVYHRRILLNSASTMWFTWFNRWICFKFALMSADRGPSLVTQFLPTEGNLVLLDGAVNSRTGPLFGAACLWGGDGSLLYISISSATSSDPLLAEAIACRTCLLLAAARPTVPRTVLLSGSLLLCNAVRHPTAILPFLFGVLSDIRILLLLNPSFSLEHVGRNIIRPAHVLARQTSHLNVTGTWPRPLIPSCLLVLPNLLY